MGKRNKNPLLILAEGDEYTYYTGELACDCKKGPRKKEALQAHTWAQEALRKQAVRLHQRRADPPGEGFHYIAIGRKKK